MWAALLLLIVGFALPVQAQQLNKVSSSLVEQARTDIHGADLRGHDGPFGRVGLGLTLLYREHQAFQQSRPGAEFESRVIPASKVPEARLGKNGAEMSGAGANGYISPVQGDRVVIDAIATTSPQQLESALNAMGATGVVRYGRVVSATLPIGQIADLAGTTSLQTARASLAELKSRSLSPRLRTWLEKRARGEVTGEPSFDLRAPEANAPFMPGAVISEGDEAMNTDDIRDPGVGGFSVDGTGVTIGVLSDTYDALGNASTDISTGDLPPASRIQVLEDLPSGSDEGRAMMQLIHDVSPGSDLAFHTALGGQANFAQGIIDLANAGADVTVDDVGYFAETFFVDGIIAQAVDAVSASGVPHFSSAGNNADQSYESDMWVETELPDGRDAFVFEPDSTETEQPIIVGASGTFGTAIFSFQWDDPAASSSLSSPGADTDLAIEILDGSGTVVASADVNNIGGDPVEVLGFDSPVTAEYTLRIIRNAGPAPGLIKYTHNGAAAILEYDTNSSTSVGHSIAAGGAGVAAAEFSNTPEFGVDPAVPESFTSLGGTPILFEIDGTRKPTAEVRDQPRFTGPDGTSTTMPGFSSFFGTSASAPHVAALAALQIQADPSISPKQVYADITSGSRDMFDSTDPTLNPGFDLLSGAGFVDALGTITGLSGEQNIVVTPQAVDFGEQFFDSQAGALFTPQSATIRVQNGGSGPLDITSVSLSGTAFSFVGGGILTGQLGVGDEILAEVELAPSSDGVYSETLTIDSDDPDTPTVTVTFDANVLLPPVVNVATTQLFEAAETGTTESEQISFENTGTTDLEYDVFAEAVGIGPFTPGDVAVPQSASMSAERGVTQEVSALPNLSGASAPKMAFDPVDFLYTLDDGSLENGIGIGSGADVAWINALQAQDGATTITALSTQFGSGAPIGTPIEFALYDDPNDDGDFTDAQLLTSVSTTVGVGGGLFQTQPITPTQVSGVFFIAVVAEGATFAAPLDQSTTSQRSSYIASASTGTFDLSNPPTVTLIDDAGFAGNWILRAQGSYVAFQPVSGTVSPGNSTTVDITFDGTSLPLGTYDGNAAVSSNDPATPQVDIPFDFFVATGVGEIADLSADGQFSFGDAGVTADLTSVTGSGRVTAAFFDQPTPDASGIDAGLNITPYRWIIVDEGNVEFDAASTLTFGRSTIPSPGFDDINGPSVDVYSRSPFETGSFSALTSSYVDNSTTTLDDDAIQATGLTGFSEFVFASDQAPLPVEIAAFDVAADNDGAILSWETASETNNAGFRIEYQKETQTSWTDTGVFVEGAGTTDQSMSYQQTISGLSPNTYTFRLRQIDVDGTETPSSGKTITVRMNDAFSLTKMSPNPLTHTGTLKLSVRDTQPVTVSLYNVLGQKVKTLMSGSMSGQSTETIRVDGSRLSSGIYFVSVVGERFQGTQKITVVR
jgi:hypothetical protein